MTARASGTLILETADVRAGYIPGVDILNGVDLHAHEGEIVTIVGPNGAGKSTLIKTVFGLLCPREGSIRFRGRAITGEKPHTISRAGISYVPQLENVFPSLTVQENLEMGALARPGVDVANRLDAMYEVFPRLAERRRQAAGTMSGGERQMVAMARALMPEPNMVLLDEPSAGLAPGYVELIFQKVVEINQSGVTVLMVEQNARQALAMSHRGYVLDLGRNRFHGPGGDLLSDPKVADLYLGGGASRGSRRGRGAGSPAPGRD